MPMLPRCLRRWPAPGFVLISLQLQVYEKHLKLVPRSLRARTADAYQSCNSTTLSTAVKATGPSSGGLSLLGTRVGFALGGGDSCKTPRSSKCLESLWLALRLQESHTTVL